ncbi:hypothetical protein WKC58_02800 [Morganella morganii]|uniref:hypothetical protein n=1 Tax=Morganella morganii TaxID=582 RepID=UPI0030FE0B47
MWWVIGFFFSLILFFFFFKKIPSIVFKILKKYNLLLNSDSLHSQRLFQLAISLPLFSSLYFMIWLGWDYPPRLDSTGFNAFLNIQKFPLGILALSPILGVFVVYAHRSLQTEKQIKTAEEQLTIARKQISTAETQLQEAQNKNKVDIYFSRRRFIIEQLKDISLGSRKNVIQSPNSLYLKYYDTNNDYIDIPRNDKIHELNVAIEFLTKRIVTLKDTVRLDYNDKNYIIIALKLHHKTIANIDTHLHKVKKLLQIKDRNKNILSRKKLQNHWKKSLKEFNLESNDFAGISKLDYSDLNTFLKAINLRLKSELENIEITLTETLSILFNKKIISEELSSHEQYKKISKKIISNYLIYEKLIRAEKDTI